MRILLLLGETESSLSAREFAFDLARPGGLSVSGLSGIDLSSLTVPMIGGIGASAYQAKLEETRGRQARENNARLHASYAEACDARGVEFSWLSFEGDPAEAFRVASETRDLIVTGHDTTFSVDRAASLPELLSNLLLLSPRPVVVCGDEYRRPRDVLVAYDGSLPAMRALQMYALLGLWREARVHVTSIAAELQLATRRAHAAADFLRSHDVHCTVVPIETRVDPSEAIRIEVVDRGIGLLVMGAFGHRGWSNALFGSTTRRLVERPPCPLFLFH
ncbi:universal stress protein [Bradyrhizobium sp. NBAIM20]|uniref:universal stress protein n=1 Tax=unclassified Bradyrhizobium TaxID=2631580 RepID=UPI001CD31FDD|nr:MULTISPECIES: universal stress protein [unclassified Bradyrhizobium]MCA1410672.1 universal stress protein [Bradyrhizobium sp. NBAIM20]MCA1463139.1 universal stress protein [Bradyrhizobium sp. NBAIM18]